MGRKERALKEEMGAPQVRPKQRHSKGALATRERRGGVSASGVLPVLHALHGTSTA